MSQTFQENKPTCRRNVLLIEVVDMKDRYRLFKNQKKRINAFIQALMQNYPGLHISFCVKQHEIAEFIIKGASVSEEDMDLVHQYLRGEICAPDKNKKYMPNKKASREAWEELTPETQRQLQSPSPYLTAEALEEHDLKTTTGPLELRQFACLLCYHWWWRTVLKSKPVSRCRGEFCEGRRYDALPKKKEFGIGRFICPKETCNRTFYAHCEATDYLKCRKCKTPTKPLVHPKWRKRRSLNPNAETFRPASRPLYNEDIGPHFYPESMLERDDQSSLEALSLDPPPAIAPSTATPRRRIFNPSMPHVPTGNTISTFLSQCDFEQNGTEVILDYDEDVDEYAVGACSFECSGCNNEYTVLCRMVDGAVCYRCNTENRALHWAPPRELDHRTDNIHSCSRCCEDGHCPNLVDARLAM